MAAKVMGRVFEIKFPKFEKLVMLKLADWFNEDQNCAWCYRQTVVDYTGLSAGTVTRVLKLLEQQEILQIEHNGGKAPNYYWLDLERAAELYGVVVPRYAKKAPFQVRRPPGKAPDSDSDRAAGPVDKSEASGSGRVASDSDRAASGSGRVASDSDRAALYEPLKNQEEKPYSTGAGAVDGPGQGDGGQAVSGDPAAVPIGRLWQEHETALIEHFGADTWRVWLGQVIPWADDGHLYTLAAPSVSIGLRLEGYLVEAAQIIGRREIRVIVRPEVHAALAERAAQRRAATEAEARFGPAAPVAAEGDQGAGGDDESWTKF